MEIECDNKTDNGGDVYSFLLQLSETDPLFEQKKKLLQVKGFNPNEDLYVKSSSSPDSLKFTLEKLLQRARIIRLDEAELYFIEVDGTTVMDSYSPINELEALNLILSLTNNKISSSTHMETDVLEDLRKMTIAMLHKFGDEHKVETKIIDKYNCDKEERLLRWGETNGIKTKFQIAYVEGAGRGAIAVKDLKVGDIALEVPVSIIICEKIVHGSDMFHILKEIDGISSETMLLLWSMRERYNRDSKFKLYFDSLPAEFNTGLSFGINALMALEGTVLLEEVMQAKQHLHAQYDDLFPALCNDHHDIFPPELFTWEQFLWACELWYSNAMTIMFTDGKLRTCLIPIAGFFNHSLCPHIMHYSKIDAATNSLRFPLSRPCNAGEQCFLSYGKLSSSHLVTFYGFLPQGDNPYDVIPLDIDTSEVDCSDGDLQGFNWISHMVRGTWFSKNHEIFHYGLPYPLLDYLRRARSSVVLDRTLTLENLETEKETLQDLQSTFEGMIYGLSDSDLNDWENSGWDVKLAVACKGLQHNIVSSVLTSCHAGLILVETEQSKLT